MADAVPNQEGPPAELPEQIDPLRAGKPAASAPAAGVGTNGSDVANAAAPTGHADTAESQAAAAKGPQAGKDLGKSFGRFQILKMRGRGAFGAVYKARDPQLDRYVALKIPHAGSISSAEDKARFFREARAAGQLHHPYIVPVFDAGRVGNSYYIASAYVEGISLRRAIKAGRFHDPREAAELLVKLAEALHYAHEQGIVHRDIKPENLLVTGAGDPYVLDFGLARRSEAEVLATVDGTVMGTPVYMSPEQARGKGNSADGRSDQWSLGVLLYELLCGARPFSGEGHELYTAILEQRPVAPRTKDPAIPADLETITLKCLAKEPAQRYRTCAELASDLTRWLSDEPIRARRTGFAERAWRWSRKNPALASAAAAIGLLAVVSTLSAIGLHHSRTEVQANANRAQAALDKLNAEAARRQRLEAALQVRQAEIAEKETKLAATEQLVRQRDRDLEDRDVKLSENAAEIKQRDARLAAAAADLDSARAATGPTAVGSAGNEPALPAAAGAAHFSFGQYQEQLRDAIAADEPGAALWALQSCPQELRGWEWDFLAKFAAGRSVRWTHDEKPGTNPASRGVSYAPLAFDADGRQLAAVRMTAGHSKAEHELVVFDDSGAEISSSAPKGLDESIPAPTFDKTGGLLAVIVGKDKASNIWFGATDGKFHRGQAQRMRYLQPCGEKAVIQAACLSPDGHALACLSQNGAQWTQGVQQLTISAVSPTQCLLRGQKIIDMKSAAAGATRPRKLHGGAGLFHSLRYSPDGQYVLLGQGGDANLLIRCDVEEDPGFWLNLTWPPDGRTIRLPAGALPNHAFKLMVSGEGAILELPSGRVIRERADAIGVPIAFSADDSRLLCIGGAEKTEEDCAWVYDSASAAHGQLRPVVKLDKAHFLGAPGGKLADVEANLAKLLLTPRAQRRPPVVVSSSQLNAFAVSWSDDEGASHLRVWGP